MSMLQCDDDNPCWMTGLTNDEIGYMFPISDWRILCTAGENCTYLYQIGALNFTGTRETPPHTTAATIWQVDCCLPQRVERQIRLREVRASSSSRTRALHSSTTRANSGPRSGTP